jgi:hypothetical protein
MLMVASVALIVLSQTREKLDGEYSSYFLGFQFLAMPERHGVCQKGREWQEVSMP